MPTGRCECGKVAFEVEAVRDTVVACHCQQCRRTSGHIWAATPASSFEALNFSEDEGLTWYASSDFAKRGFCKFCGSSLFYKMHAETPISIAAGCLDLPTGMRTDKHIFVKDKGDYYDIEDGPERLETF